MPAQRRSPTRASMTAALPSTTERRTSIVTFAAARGDAVRGDVVVDAQLRAVAGALDQGRGMELGPDRVPVVVGEPAPQALGGVHGISSTILPSLAPAVKRS